MIMPSRRTIVTAAAVFMLSFGNVAAEAPPEQVQDAARFIASLGDQAITALRANSRGLERREATFRGLLAQGFDVPFIGRFVLGRHWRQASAEQRSDYLALFREFLLKTYSRRLGGSTGETFTVTGAHPTGRQHIIVRTQIERAIGAPIEADWRVRVIDRQYKIIDVAVEGVSMAATQRAEFTTVIRNHGMDGLLQALRLRTQTYTAKAS